MVPRLSHFLAAAFVLLIVAPRPAEAIPVLDQSDGAIDYRIESLTDANRNLASRFGGPELALLEKLNRTDLKHLPRLQQLIVPSAWRLELDYSPFPATYPAAKT